jgi:hypothetical protein
VGIFLAGLGLLIWLITKANEVNTRTKAFSIEKGLDKKSQKITHST